MSDEWKPVQCPSCQAAQLAPPKASVQCYACHARFTAPDSPEPNKPREESPESGASPISQRLIRQRKAGRHFRAWVLPLLAGLVVISGVIAVFMIAGGNLSPHPADDPSAADLSREADAQRKTVRIHHVTVRVTRVEIGEVRGRDAKNRVVASDERNYLHVHLRIENVSTLPVEYRSWYGHAFDDAGTARVAQLADDAGRSYDMMVFADVRSIRGHIAEIRLEPDQRIQDVLIFRLPDETALDKIQHLSLELPALAHGDPGSYRFRIPRSMIVGPGPPERTEPQDSPASPAEPDST